jgi:phosphohistidine phosphatase
VDRIKHSDKLRARQTADILAASLKPQDGVEQVSGMAPNDDVSAMRINLHSETGNVMLVGHLPYLSRLLSSLLLVDENRPLIEFRMGGVVCLGRAENGQFRILWAITPELLCRLGFWRNYVWSCIWLRFGIHGWNDVWFRA